MLTRRNFIANSASAAAAITIINPLMNKVYANDNYLEIEPDQLRFRQIHLDFHTPGMVTEIAKDFDPDKFAQTLKKAHVNSVTVFAKCCHGYFYYDTDVFPALRHPHLNGRNLLKEQIDALHKVGIRAPIYTVIQWDAFQSTTKQEWLMRDEKGAPVDLVPPPGFYRFLCVNNEYTTFTKKYIEEIHKKLPVDGWFIDIVFERACYCPNCVEGMKKKGLNQYTPGDADIYYKLMFKEWKTDMTKFIRSMSKDCTIFYNTGHVAPYIRRTIDNYSHIELESLPSGSDWGYIHFPLTSRYARKFGKDIMGMTGKFHTSWGDFHSYKNKAALELEVFTMLAMTAKCSIGDQLHPYGKLDDATYELIGSVYEQVERKEPWCSNAKPVVDIGVFNIEEFEDTKGQRQPAQSVGVVRILQEGKHQFDVIDSLMDFSKYKLLILPDSVPVSGAFKSKLENYIAKGGKVIASFRSGLSDDGKNFELNIGASFEGDAPYNPDFLVPGSLMNKNLSAKEYVMYLKAMKVKVNSAEILADVHEPFFNRSAEHYFSHIHAPSSGKKAKYPGIIKNGNVIYFAHPVFTQYAKNGALWCKKLLLNAIDVLLPEPLVKTNNVPSAVTVTLNEQSEKKRLILHALYYVPERRGEAFDVVEDIVPIRDISFKVRTSNKVKKVIAVPDGTQIQFKQLDNYVLFNIQKLQGHQMIELSY